MTSFLPELILPVSLMRSFGETQTGQDLFNPLGFKIIDNAPGRIGLEAADKLIQPIRLRDKMTMVFQYHIAIQFQALLSLITPAVQQYLHGVGTGKNRQPFQHRAGQEVGLTRFGNGVSASTQVILP